MSNEFGFEERGDPNKIEKSGFDPFPDGEVLVVKIAKFVKVDDRSLPIFAVVGGELKAMFELDVPQTEKDRLSAVTGTKIERGPVMSATRAEMAALVAAFGGDVSALPKDDSTAFLLAAMSQIETNTTPRKAKVYRGWVQYVEGANPPAGHYQWKFTEMRSADRSEPVRFIDREFPSKNGGKYTQSILYASFEVVGDGWGNASPYNGYSVELKIQNPFDVPGQDRPRFQIGKEGGTPVHVDRFKKFVAAFCPEVFQHAWQRDAEKSVYGIDELSNPMPVINDLAKKAQVVTMNHLDFSAGGMPKLDLAAFSARPAVADRDVQQAKAMQQSSALEELYHLIENTLTPNHDVFEKTSKSADKLNLKLTDWGAEWAKKNLVPAWDALSLPLHKGMRLIGKLNDEDLKVLTAYLTPADENIPFDVDDTAEDDEEGF